MRLPTMKYTFMQKNEKIMDVDMDTYSGDVESILSVHVPERLPLSVLYKPAEASTKNTFQEWINYRNVPTTRDVIGNIFKSPNTRINALSLKSLGLNLSDQYWFKPYSANIKWEEVNFFQNDFTGHPLGMRFKKEITTPIVYNSLSPDYSSNGNLPKFWYIDNGMRFLAKAGKRPYHQQLFNEIVACKLLQKAELPHIAYDLKNIDGNNYSICSTFVSPDTEYIPAHEIFNVVPFEEKNGRYKHFLACSEALGIPNVRPMLDAMLQFDYLINNTDRHMGNFGFIRDVNTLKILGMAPIFDNGNSLWFDSPKSLINEYHQPSYPFAAKQDKQLKLTEPTIPWINKLSAKFIADTITQEFAKHEIIDEDRTEKIIKTVLKLRENIIKFQLRRTAHITQEDTPTSTIKVVISKQNKGRSLP